MTAASVEKHVLEGTLSQPRDWFPLLEWAGGTMPQEQQSRGFGAPQGPTDTLERKQQTPPAERTSVYSEVSFSGMVSLAWPLL